MSLGSLGSGRRRSSANGVLSSSKRGRPLGDDSYTAWLDNLEPVIAWDKTTTPTTSTGGSLPAGVPGQWWADARVKKLQELLNVELVRAGCSTKLSVDGLIGPSACGAMTWASKGKIGPELTSLLAAYGKQFAAGCGYVTKAPVVPTCAPPQPVTTLPFPVGVVHPEARRWQQMLNAELGARGLPKVAETGMFDRGTCVGLDAFQRSYVAAPTEPEPADDFAIVFATYFPAAVTACRAIVAAQAAPPPASPPAVLTAADVAAIQGGLNAEVLGPGGMMALPTDGKLSKATCGAANYAVSNVKAGKLSLSAPLAALLNKASLQIGCDPLYPWTAPSKVAVAIAPAAIPAPTAAEVMLLQKLLNSEALAPGRFQPIPEDGRVSGLLCGTAGATLTDVTAGKLKVSATLAGLLVSSSIRAACAKTGPVSFPAKLPAAVPPPPPVQVTPRLPSPPTRSALLPPLNRDGECVINAGQRYAEIGVIQQQLNTALMRSGYKPIAVTNVWDAATCGALFAMGGQFSPKASSACPHFYSVPLSCPAVAAPAKIVVAPPPPPPPPPPPVKQASMALPLGIAAVVGVAAIVYAKKKGLIMAAKKAAVKA